MKNLLLIAATASAFLLPSFAQAAPPSHPYHLTTVSWIISKDDDLKADDHYVSLIGHITGRADDGDYIFTDGTGTIRFDCEDNKLPIGAKIVIGGRIDQAYLGIGHLEVDVRTWYYAKKKS